MVWDPIPLMTDFIGIFPCFLFSSMLRNPFSESSLLSVRRYDLFGSILDQRKLTTLDMLSPLQVCNVASSTSGYKDSMRISSVSAALRGTRFRIWRKSFISVRQLPAGCWMSGSRLMLWGKSGPIFLSPDRILKRNACLITAGISAVSFPELAGWRVSFSIRTRITRAVTPTAFPSKGLLRLQTGSPARNRRK